MQREVWRQYRKPFDAYGFCHGSSGGFFTMSTYSTIPIWNHGAAEDRLWPCSEISGQLGLTILRLNIYSGVEPGPGALRIHENEWSLATSRAHCRPDNKICGPPYMRLLRSFRSQCCSALLRERLLSLRSGGLLFLSVSRHVVAGALMLF